jgi:hypothetical protein
MKFNHDMTRSYIKLVVVSEILQTALHCFKAQALGFPAFSEKNIQPIGEVYFCPHKNAFFSLTAVQLKPSASTTIFFRHTQLYVTSLLFHSTDSLVAV